MLIYELILMELVTFMFHELLKFYLYKQLDT